MYYSYINSDLCNSNEQRLQWKNNFFQLAVIQNPLRETANSTISPADIEQQKSNRQIINENKFYENFQVMEASALTGEGIAELKQWLIKVTPQASNKNK